MPRGKKKTTRKNVTTACLKCKVSKIKCTGSFPCGNCTRKVMNGCKACKHNIKDADISNLGACGQCIIDASNFFCEFPQEKARPVLFDYPNKESSMVLDNNDDSLFHEFFFEEPIPDFVPCEHPPSTEMDPLLGHSQAPPSIFAQEGTEESAPQASGIATRKMISSS
ncbi:14128_t:CDS:2, partial [Entrophospora sp. SA101]